jgi:hypothetical protein
VPLTYSEAILGTTSDEDLAGLGGRTQNALDFFRFLVDLSQNSPGTSSLLPSGEHDPAASKEESRSTPRTSRTSSSPRRARRMSHSAGGVSSHIPARALRRFRASPAGMALPRRLR